MITARAIIILSEEFVSLLSRGGVYYTDRERAEEVAEAVSVATGEPWRLMTAEELQNEGLPEDRYWIVPASDLERGK